MDGESTRAEFGEIKIEGIQLQGLDGGAFSGNAASPWHSRGAVIRPIYEKENAAATELGLTATWE